MRWFRTRSLLACAVLACGCARHGAEQSYPEKLSGWRLDGAIPYSVSAPLFSDGADKQRTMWLPPGTAASAAPDGTVVFPEGTVLTKTFSYPSGGREKRIETRVIARRRDGWVALPYVWNAEQTEATLAPSGDFTTVAYRGRSFEYAIPNVNQCRTCHDQAGTTVPLGPKLRTLDAQTLTRLGLRREPARYAGAEESARAYLDANCAHCHNPNGPAGANDGFDLRYEQADRAKLGIGLAARKPLAAGPRLLIRPGAPADSAILSRMKTTDPQTTMPPLGHSLLDEDGIRTVAGWIRSQS